VPKESVTRVDFSTLLHFIAVLKKFLASFHCIFTNTWEQNT
jgi:hypothetical protein